MPTQSPSHRSSLAPAPVPGEVLVGSLRAYDVPFLAGEATDDQALAPAPLMSALISHPEARLRLALIPLLLRQPEFSAYAPQVADALREPTRITFQCFYTAAYLLQAKYLPRLEAILGDQQRLPDLFAAELGVLAQKDIEATLRALGKRQQVLSSEALNWHGTYEHGAQRLVTRLETERRWGVR